MSATQSAFNGKAHAITSASVGSSRVSLDSIYRDSCCRRGTFHFLQQVPAQIEYFEIERPAIGLVVLRDCVDLIDRKARLQRAIGAIHET